MNYRPKNKIIIAACVILVLLIGIRTFFATSFNKMIDATASLFSPIQKNLAGSSSQNKMLQDQIYDLEARNAVLSAQVQNPLQNISPQSSSATLQGRIIAKPPETLFDTFILSFATASSTATPRVGASVYEGQVLVGQIVSVEGLYAHAVLFSSSGQSRPASVSRTGATISLVGNGGGTFVLRVPKDFDIQVGDVLIDQNTGSVLAQVFLVGVVGTDSFKQVLAKIPGNIFATQWVEVSK